jgi:hypothetical protein
MKCSIPKLKWLLSASLVCAAQVVFGATYYVAADGNDGNPGSSSQPWRTIQKAANTMGAGDSVLVQPGVYAERVTSVRAGAGAGARITFQAGGAVEMHGFTVNHPYLTVRGFDVRRAPAPANGDSLINVGTGGDDFELLSTTVRDGIQITRTDMMFNAGSGTISSTTGGFLAAGFAAGQTIYVGAATNGLSIDAANRGTHVLSDVTDTTLTVAGGGLVDQGPLYIYLSASYTFGLSFSSGAENCVVRSNVFRNLGYDAWFILGTGHLLEDNVIEQVNGWDAMHFGGTGHLFRRNQIRNSPLFVYQVSPDAMENFSPSPYFNVTFTNNLFYGFAGVLASQKGQNTSSGLRIVRNVFVDVGRYSLTHPGTTIENNTFLRVAKVSNPVLSRASHAILVNTTVGATNAVIRNNLFVDCGQPSNLQTIDQVGWYEVSGPTETVVAEGNFVAGPGPGFGSKTGWPEGNPALNGGDPGFVNINDPLGPDGIPFTDDDGLRLLATSKLVNAGVGGVTIGAYSVDTPPTLAISHTAGGPVRVTWPEEAAGWTLQGAPTVFGTWTNVPGLGPAVDGWFEYNFQPTEAGAFLRLVR